jgi:hypothetical protein
LPESDFLKLLESDFLKVPESDSLIVPELSFSFSSTGFSVLLLLVVFVLSDENVFDFLPKSKELSIKKFLRSMLFYNYECIQILLEES